MRDQLWISNKRSPRLLSELSERLNFQTELAVYRINCLITEYYGNINGKLLGYYNRSCNVDQ